MSRAFLPASGLECSITTPVIFTRLAYLRGNGLRSSTVSPSSPSIVWLASGIRLYLDHVSDPRFRNLFHTSHRLCLHARSRRLEVEFEPCRVLLETLNLDPHLLLRQECPKLDGRQKGRRKKGRTPVEDQSNERDKHALIAGMLSLLSL